LAHELQTKSLGGQSKADLKRVASFGASGKLDSAARTSLPGTWLSPTWPGDLHQVAVLGFDYHGEWFSSLSEVATRITGAVFRTEILRAREPAGEHTLCVLNPAVQVFATSVPHRHRGEVPGTRRDSRAQPERPAKSVTWRTGWRTRQDEDENWSLCLPLL